MLLTIHENTPDRVRLTLNLGPNHPDWPDADITIEAYRQPGTPEDKGTAEAEARVVLPVGPNVTRVASGQVTRVSLWRE